MDINNKKYKRKLSDRDPWDQFEGGPPDDSCADNGREMYPKMKQRKRKRLFGQEVGAEDTLCRTAGTDKDNHTHKHRHKKKKSVASLQVDLQVEDSVKSREQNPPLQEGGRHPVEKESSHELRSGKSLDLSGDQEMIGTRNSKRRRNKKRKKGLQAQESGVGREAALQYLHLWDNNRSHWCFRKKAQFWLLQNMYEEDKVPKPEFKILLRYLEGLQGNQRRLAVEKAQEMLEGYEGDNLESGVKISKKQSRRAVALLRKLA